MTEILGVVQVLVTVEIDDVGNPGIGEVGEHLTGLQCFCSEVIANTV